MILSVVRTRLTLARSHGRARRRRSLRARNTTHIFLASMSDTKKTQRWIDLLAALLSHHYPVTFEELARDVPAYDLSAVDGDTTKLASIKKMFERDKAELLEQGVPLVSISVPEE